MDAVFERDIRRMQAEERIKILLVRRQELGIRQETLEEQLGETDEEVERLTKSSEKQRLIKKGALVKVKPGVGFTNFSRDSDSETNPRRKQSVPELGNHLASCLLQM